MSTRTAVLAALLQVVLLLIFGLLLVRAGALQ